MITIIRSELCLELFRRELHLPPFFYNQVAMDYRVLDMQQDMYHFQNTSPFGLLIYTNIWPLTNDIEVINIITRQMTLNSAATAVVSGFDENLTRVVYPRKSDVRFPGVMIGYVTLLPTLLRSATIQYCFTKSVSLTMLAELAWDITFPHIIQNSHIDLGKIQESLNKEYDVALQELENLNLEIHGYQKTDAVPYAVQKEPT